MQQLWSRQRKQDKSLAPSQSASPKPQRRLHRRRARADTVVPRPFKARTRGTREVYGRRDILIGNSIIQQPTGRLGPDPW